MSFGIQDNGLVFLPREDPGRRRREYKLRIGRNAEGVACIYFTNRYKMKEMGFIRGSDVPEVEIVLSEFLSEVFRYLGMEEAEVQAACSLK